MEKKFLKHVFRHDEPFLIRYDENKTNKLKGAKVDEFLSLEEHNAILAGVNNQLQACARQIDQFQSKLCEQDEALKTARDDLEICANQLAGISLAFQAHGTNLNVNFLIPYYKESSERAKEAKQKIEEILTKENENGK